MSDINRVLDGLKAHGCGESMWKICSICPYSDTCEAPSSFYKCTDELLRDAFEVITQQQKRFDTVTRIGENDRILCKQVQCPRCGDRFDFRFIIENRQPVYPVLKNNKIYCGSCGKRIPRKIKARFCHKCGKKINLGEGEKDGD